MPWGSSSGDRDDSRPPGERAGDRREDVEGGNVDPEVDDRLSDTFLRYNEDAPAGTTW